MIEVHPMLVEDFLLVMEQNANIYPEFAALPNDLKRYLANHNIIHGTAESFFEDGRLVGVGGICYVGIGEAWMITPPQVRDNRSLSLLKETKATFIKGRDEHNLWRVFSESKISETFLRHLQFKEHPQGFVWTRK